MTGRVVDFDAFRREQQREPLHLIIGGRTWDLPPSLPASLALDILRLQEQADGKADVQVDDLVKVGAAIFGTSEAFAEVMSAAEVGLDELPDLVRMVLEAYTGSDPNPTAQAPTNRASRRSATGR